MNTQTPQSHPNGHDKHPEGHEPEHVGSIWKHPYLIYILLTCVLAVFLGVVGWLAWTNGWIPNRGIGGSSGP